MQTVSVAFTAACTATVQRPVYYVEFSWSRDGAISAARAGTNWTNESANVISYDSSMQINPPGEQLVMAGSTGGATITLDNTTGRYSWLRSDSALTAYIGGAEGFSGIPVRVWQGYYTTSAEYVCVFTGVVSDWNQVGGTVTLQCSDWGWTFLQDKLSTAVATDQRPDQWIASVATLAGVGGSDRALDVGIYPIPFVWLDDESAVEEIWAAANVDGGLAYFNQLGKLVYRNPISWVSQAVVWDFTESDYRLAAPRYSSDALATKVIVEYTGRYVGSVVDIYRLEQYRVIQPGETQTWTARYNYAAYATYAPDPAVPYEDYYANSLGGTDMTAQLTVTLGTANGQQVEVSVTNNSTNTAARLSVFRIRGFPLIGGPTEQAEATTGAPGSVTRVRSERGNMYMQTYEQANALAQILARQASQVRPTYPLQDAPPVPQLELLDKVTFANEDALGESETMTGLVVGIRSRGGVDGFYQTIDIMDTAGMSEYDNYFIIGTDELGDSKRAYF